MEFVRTFSGFGNFFLGDLGLFATVCDRLQSGEKRSFIAVAHLRENEGGELVKHRLESSPIDIQFRPIAMRNDHYVLPTLQRRQPAIRPSVRSMWTEFGRGLSSGGS